MKEKFENTIPAELKHLVFEGFPGIPIGMKVIVKKLPLKQFVSKGGIAIIQPAGQEQKAAGTATMCQIMAISRETAKEYPYLKAGDKVYVNQLSGNSFKLFMYGQDTEFYVMFSINLEMNFYGIDGSNEGTEEASDNPLSTEEGKLKLITST